MSTKPQPASNSILDLLAQDITRSFTIGVDADGYDHHYYQGADAVVVYDADNGELDHYQPLDGRTVAEWWEYVNQRRGWREEGQLANLGISEDRRQKAGGQ